MKIARIFSIFLACAILALFSLNTTVSNLNNPSLASLAFSKNGHVQIKKAMSLYKQDAIASVSRNQKPKVGEEVLKLAREGIAREPLAVSGYYLIGVSVDDEGKPKNALKIIRGASKLSTRNLFINSWLIEHFSKLNDVSKTFEHVDRLIRVNRDMEELLITVMAQALKDERVIALMLEKLEQRPPWSGKFWWSTVKTSDEGMKNAARLRKLAYNQELTVPVDFDASLVSELVRRGHFNEAYQMAVAISSGSNEKSANLVRNGAFDGPQSLPPVDWSISTEMALGGFIDRKAGQLQLSAAANATGLLAEQVLRVPEGTYELSVEFIPPQLPRKGQISISLACVAGYGSAPEWEMKPDGANSNARFTNTGNCSVYRLSINASENDGEGFDFSLSNISILSSPII